MLTGENGIITRATEAREETGKKGLKEEIDLAVENDHIEDKAYKNGILEEELNKINGATVTKVAEDAYYVERDGNSYTVYEDGTIEEGKTDIWDGETIEKPEVDEQNNWHIYTTGQMKFFANYCNNTLTEEEKAEANMPEITESTIVYLENDLDMGARQKDGELVSGIQWTPVDMQKGTFEGNNYIISGIYVSSDSGNFVGLFSSVDIIQNLSIKNSYIENISEDGFPMIGGITGTAKSIINCHNINTIVKDEFGGLFGGAIGGVIGNVNQRTTKVEKCTNSGEVIGKNNVGGVEGASLFSGELIDCINTGKVTGSGSHVGGIVSSLSEGKSISNCYNTGEVIGHDERVGGIVGELGANATVTDSYNEGKVTGIQNVGGIAGIIFGTIENSYNKGQIQAEAQIGGIAGQIGAEYEANIRNCYNEGEIIGNVSAIGGIVGWTSVTGTSGTIENNYNKGIVRGTTSVGGIIGRNAETFTVTKCYNKGTVEGTTNIGSVIGEQSGKNDNISNLYYLSTLNIGGVNGEDIVNKNIIGVSDDINSYDDFLIWIEKK